MFIAIFRIIILVLVAVSASAAVDPTQPPGYGSASKPAVQFHLNSVLVSEDRKVAIINGSPKSEGEMISGAKVISISNTLVRLSKDGRMIELKPMRAAIRREN